MSDLIFEPEGVLHFPSTPDDVESLRRWLREREDEIRILRTTINNLHRQIESLQHQVAAASASADQWDRLDAKAQAYFAALAALVEHLHPGRSLTDMDRWDPPWPQVVEALRR